MSSPFRKIIAGCVVFLGICVWAVLGYMSAGWKLTDAIYMVVITIFGVGYGEVHPIDTFLLRALTITLIVIGYASLLYTAGGFMQMLIDGEINKALGARKMNKEIDRLHDHTIICGIGRLGARLASELAENGKPFVVIDGNVDRLEEARQRGYLVIHGDATEEEILEQAGIDRATTLATVLSDDAANVFVTITARGLNQDITIIARGEDPRTEKKLLGSGANKVILPTAIGAEKVAQLIIRPSAETMIEKIAGQSVVSDELNQIGLNFDELTVQPGSPLVDREIGQLEIRSNHGFLIIGIRSESGSIKLSPEPDTKLNAGDVVIVLGRADDIPELESKFKPSSAPMSYRGVKMER
ncbi:potassium channel protein [Mariniblastus sp.]|nr:potassium channel protein [Mariniblastus sp.]